MLNVLRYHELNTSYFWPLQLQEALKVEVLKSRHLLVWSAAEVWYIFLTVSFCLSIYIHTLGMQNNA